MRKLNKKGYMLVEIIVAFSLTFAILISLTNLLIKFKDTNTDLFYSTKYLKDKNIITRNIMSDIEKLNITNVSLEGTNTLTITHKIETEDPTIPPESKTKKLTINGNTITYGSIDNVTNTFINDTSYYKKEIESSLKINGIENCSKITSKYFCAKIKITSIYSDENYDLTLFSTNIKT